MLQSATTSSLVLVICIPWRRLPWQFSISWCSRTMGRSFPWTNLRIMIPSLKPIWTMSCLPLGAVNPSPLILKFILKWAPVSSNIPPYLGHITTHLPNFHPLGHLSFVRLPLPINLWPPHLSHRVCHPAMNPFLSLWESPLLPHPPQCHIWEENNAHDFPLHKSPPWRNYKRRPLRH